MEASCISQGLNLREFMFQMVWWPCFNNLQTELRVLTAFLHRQLNKELQQFKELRSGASVLEQERHCHVDLVCEEPVFMVMQVSAQKEPVTLCNWSSLRLRMEKPSPLPFFFPGPALPKPGCWSFNSPFIITTGSVGGVELNWCGRRSYAEVFAHTSFRFIWVQ